MSAEYERALLGAILQDSLLMDRLRLDLSLFYDSKHRAIFAAIQGLHEAGKPIDLLTVSESLNGSLATVGPSYLARLTDAPTAANAKLYFEELRDASKTRGLHRIATELEQDAKDGKSADECISRTMAQLVELQAKGAELDTVRPREILHEIISDAESRMASKTAGLTGGALGDSSP